MNESVDEFAIFNRTLSANEIRNLYKRGVLSLNLSVRSCDATFANIPGERSAALTINTCVCPASGSWVIKEACVLTTACSMDGSNIYITSGNSLTINSGGNISNFGDVFAYGNLFCRADVCFG